MAIDHKTAMKLWEAKHGDQTTAQDYKKREIHKGAYGQEGSQYGWNIHHKIPQSQRGTNEKGNLEIVHFKTHQELNGQ